MRAAISLALIAAVCAQAQLYIVGDSHARSGIESLIAKAGSAVRLMPYAGVTPDKIAVSLKSDSFKDEMEEAFGSMEHELDVIDRDISKDDSNSCIIGLSLGDQVARALMARHDKDNAFALSKVFMARYASLLKKWAAEHSTCKFFILSLPPPANLIDYPQRASVMPVAGDDWMRLRYALHLNAVLRIICDETNIGYVDRWEPHANDRGVLAEQYTNDGFHLSQYSAEAQNDFANIVRRYLRI